MEATGKPFSPGSRRQQTELIFNEHIVQLQETMAGSQPWWSSGDVALGVQWLQALLILSGCPPGVGLLQVVVCAGCVVLVLMLRV